MNELVTKENKKIEDMIYEIRGVHVMLDSDLDYIMWKQKESMKQ